MKKRKTNVCTGGGQSLNKKAFTLIELLAVLVILAIIALIAVPQILNIIKDSKIKSEKISAENYLRAVDISIINKDMDSDTRVLDGWYSIQDNGKTLVHQEYPERTLYVQYEGQVLTSGEIEIKNNKVVSTFIMTDNLTITKNNGGKLNFYKTDQIEKSILISGSKFNATLKNLVNKPTDMKYDTEDNSIISIEFYSKGLLPNGHTKDSLSLLPHISVSDKNDIFAYNDNGKVYIVSDNLINFNQNSSYMFYRFKGLTQINFININTSDVTNMASMFSESNKIANLNLNKFDTSKVTTMDYMFRWCGNLTALDLSNFRTEKVISMKEMFNGCSSLISLDLSNFNTSNITDMFNMFINCSSLTSLDLSSFDTSKVTGMGYMFYGCSGLTSLDLSSFDTSSLTSMDSMFTWCSSLTYIDLSSFNTTNVTNMNALFKYCKKLTTLDLSNFDTTNVKSMQGMFFRCTSLTNLNLSNFDTTNVKSMGEMFYDCYNLTSLNISNFNTENVNSMYYMFTFTSKLETIVIGCDWKTIGNINDIFYISKIKPEQFNKLVEDTQATCSTTEVTS